ncbi:MAG: galactose mutarotase [Acidobacteriaceae bacterium]|nr:galactose mutarotase [Acidobacteriaceae bacterium]
MSQPVPFGRFNGAEVYEIALGTEAGTEMKVITYGAIIRDLKVPAPEGVRRVLLGFNTLEAYVDNKRWHLGAVPGRVANRIAGGRFLLDGRPYSLPRNEAGRHTLHSGDAGLGARNWAVVDVDDRSVTLAVVADDGEDGFSGRLTATVTYRLVEAATLQIIYSATTDRATPINLTNHAYFNLDGGGDILLQRLALNADFFTPTDADLIPTGEILSVKGTPWDFRSERPFLFQTDGGPFHYDGNVVLRGSGALEQAACAASSNGDLTMEVWTNQPGLQVFDAATLRVSALGLDGERLSPRSGFCLEPQVFPDSINRRHFPNSVLRPGEVYAHHTEYRFDR